MDVKKSLFRYPFFLFILFYLLFGCNDKKEVHQTDLDNLYAFKRTKQQQDSIAVQYTKVAQKILQSKNTLEEQDKVDSIIKQLRWGSNTSLFFKLVAVAERDAKRSDDLNRLAHLYEHIAVYYHDKQQLDSVYTYYLKAEHLYKKNSDSIALAENMYYQARLLYEVDFYEESETKLKDALAILKQIPNNPVNIEGNLLKTFYRLGDNDNERKKESLKALKGIYYRLNKDKGVYALLPKEKFVLAYSNLCGNIGLHYLELNNLSEAKKFCLEGLEYAKEMPYNQVYAHLNWLYYETLYLQGQKENIVENLKLSYDTYIKINLPFQAVLLASYIAEICQDQGQLDQSLHWLLKAYKLADDNKYYKLKKEVIEQLLKSHPNYNTQQLVVELIESSYHSEKEQNKTKESFVNIEFNSFMLTQENEALKQKINFVYVIAFGVIGGLVFILVVVRLRNKNRELKQNNDRQAKNEQILKLLLEKNTIEHEAILKERNRIAKDLHDGVINDIFTLRFNTQLFDKPEEEFKEELVKELRGIETTIRNVSHSLMQTEVFKNKSFEKLLDELVRKQNNENQTIYSFECDICLEHLSTVEKVNIYQIIQESFQNVNKHANARNCHLCVVFDKDHIIFSVKDDGLGIKQIFDRGMGVKNMKERAQSILAQLDIESQVNKGTTVLLYVPN